MECVGRIHQHYSPGCEICGDLKRCVNICLETHRDKWDKEEEGGDTNG